MTLEAWPSWARERSSCGAIDTWLEQSCTTSLFTFRTRFVETVSVLVKPRPRLLLIDVAD